MPPPSSATIVHHRSESVRKKREFTMRRIVHHRAGNPLEVLEIDRFSSPDELSADYVAVRMTYAPIHPGDLLGIEASPAAGDPPAIGALGRIPGFEGAGVIERIGSGVNDADLQIGQRVAFFPAGGAWKDTVVVPRTSVVALPDDVPDRIGAQMLINTITARMLMRAGHNSVPPDRLVDVTVLLTGAGSAVGRIVASLLREAGVSVVGLVRTEESAASLRKLHAHAGIVATDGADWKGELRTIIRDRDIYVAIDGVGGDLLADLPQFLVKGATIVNFGTLGGAKADIRSIVPNRLVLKGVTMAAWTDESEEVRRDDVSKALELASREPALFAVAQEYDLDHLRDAVEHVHRRGKVGTVLLRF